MSQGGFLRERRLRLGELEGPVRRIILTTYVVLLALAVGVSIRERLPGHEVLVVGVVYTQSTIVVISGFLAAFAFATLLAGAAHARTRWRYALVAPILLAIFLCVAAAPAAHPGESTTWRNLGMMALPLPFMAATIWLVRRAPRLRTITTLFISLGLAGAFGGLVLGLTLLTRTPYASNAVVLLLGLAPFALMPALLVVGFDLSELGAEAATVGLRRFDGARQRPGVIGWGLIAVGLMACLAIDRGMGHEATQAFWLWGGLVAVAALMAGRLISRRPSSAHAGHGELGYLQVLAVAIAIVASIVAGGIFEETKPGFANYEGARNFSIAIPDGMTEGFHDTPTGARAPIFTRVGFLTNNRPPTLTIIGQPHPFEGFGVQQVTDINELIAVRTLPLMPLVLGPPDKDGWRHGDGTTTNARGIALHFLVLSREQVTGDAHSETTWYLVCGGTAADAARVTKICDNARKTFSNFHALRSSRPLAVVFSVSFVLAALLVFGLAQRRSRRGDAALLDFTAWVLLLTGLRWIGGFLLGGADEPLDDLKFAADLMAALVAVTTLATVALALWPKAKGLRFDLSGAQRTASLALFSLLVISALFFLYVFAVGSGEHSQTIRGVIIVLALTWELATCGPTMNPANEHHAFPRGSRVLIFVGYLVLVGTCVFMFGEARATGGQHVVAWDTEKIVAAGLVTLGGALVISRALGAIPGLLSCVREPMAPSS